MIIEKTAENYDILKTYHGLVRDLYKDLESTIEKIKKITSNHNKLVKDKFKMTPSDMHRILLNADFWKEYNDYCRCDVLISNYIKQKEEVYYCLQDYMTNSCKVEFLSVLRITNGAIK
jgi:hypothetical protein